MYYRNIEIQRQAFILDAPSSDDEIPCEIEEAAVKKTYDTKTRLNRQYSEIRLHEDDFYRQAYTQLEVVCRNQLQNLDDWRKNFIETTNMTFNGTSDIIERQKKSANEDASKRILDYITLKAQLLIEQFPEQAEYFRKLGWESPITMPDTRMYPYKPSTETSIGEKIMFPVYEKENRENFDFYPSDDYESNEDYYSSETNENNFQPMENFYAPYNPELNSENNEEKDEASYGSSTELDKSSSFENLKYINDDDDSADKFENVLSNPFGYPHENPPEDPQENPHENPQENPHENPQENPQENPHENPQENLHENPQENLHENPQENLHENPQENLHENEITTQPIQNESEEINHDFKPDNIEETKTEFSTTPSPIFFNTVKDYEALSYKAACLRNGIPPFNSIINADNDNQQDKTEIPNVTEPADTSLSDSSEQTDDFIPQTTTEKTDNFENDQPTFYPDYSVDNSVNYHHHTYQPELTVKFIVGQIKIGEIVTLNLPEGLALVGKINYFDSDSIKFITEEGEEINIPVAQFEDGRYFFLSMDREI